MDGYSNNIRDVDIDIDVSYVCDNVSSIGPDLHKGKKYEKKGGLIFNVVNSKC